MLTSDPRNFKLMSDAPSTMTANTEYIIPIDKARMVAGFLFKITVNYDVVTSAPTAQFGFPFGIIGDIHVEKNGQKHHETTGIDCLIVNFLRRRRSIPGQHSELKRIDGGGVSTLLTVATSKSFTFYSWYPMIIEGGLDPITQSHTLLDPRLSTTCNLVFKTGSLGGEVDNSARIANDTYTLNWVRMMCMEGGANRFPQSMAGSAYQCWRSQKIDFVSTGLQAAKYAEVDFPVSHTVLISTPTADLRDYDDSKVTKVQLRQENSYIIDNTWDELKWKRDISPYPFPQFFENPGSDTQIKGVVDIPHFYSGDNQAVPPADFRTTEFLFDIASANSTVRMLFLGMRRN